MSSGIPGSAIVSGQAIAAAAVMGSRVPNAAALLRSAPVSGTRVDPLWERDFFTCLQRGEIPKAQADKIVLEGYEWLVKRAAWPFFLRVPRHEQESLLQSGRIGLLLATPRFSPDRGARFSSYAVHHILNEVRDQFECITGSINSSPEIRKIMAIAQRLAKESGAYPSAREVAEEAGKSEQRALEVMLAGAMKTLSLDASTRDGDHLLHDIVGESFAYEQELDRAMMEKRLASALQRLDLKERTAIELLYGLSDDEVSGHKRSWVARRLGITVPRLGLLERAALRELQRLFGMESETPK